MMIGGILHRGEGCSECVDWAMIVLLLQKCYCLLFHFLLAEMGGCYCTDGCYNPADDAALAEHHYLLQQHVPYYL